MCYNVLSYWRFIVINKLEERILKIITPKVPTLELAKKLQPYLPEDFVCERCWLHRKHRIDDNYSSDGFELKRRDQFYINETTFKDYQIIWAPDLTEMIPILAARLDFEINNTNCLSNNIYSNLVSALIEYYIELENIRLEKE